MVDVLLILRGTQYFDGWRTVGTLRYSEFWCFAYCWYFEILSISALFILLLLPLFDICVSLYCSISSISRLDTGYTGQLSVLDAWILMILLNTKYLEIRYWLRWFATLPPISSCGLKLFYWVYGRGTMSFMCLMYNCYPCSATISKIGGRPRCAQCSEGEKTATTSTHWCPHFDINFHLRYRFFSLCLFPELGTSFRFLSSGTLMRITRGMASR